jgi:hypothetical protein
MSETEDEGKEQPEFWKPAAKFEKPKPCKKEGCKRFGWYVGYCHKHRAGGLSKHLTQKKKREEKLRKKARIRMKKLAHKKKQAVKAEKVAQRKALSRVSAKRKSQEALYSLLRKDFLTKNPLCEVCRIDATDVHHKRGRNGERLIEVEYFMAVCRTCHDKIHSNPTWAYEQGYLIRK